MTDETLEAAIRAAEEFLHRAAAFKASGEDGGDSYIYRSPMASGALRRQSMELTRALAVWRKP